MSSTEDYILSLYREVATLDTGGRVKLIFNDREKRIYVKKLVEPSVGEIYNKIKLLDDNAFPKVKEIADCGEYCVVIEEYIAGCTLREVVNGRGGIDVKMASEYIYQVCRAVDALHKSGIVHRDITESNVMLTEEGRIKLIDFNISHRADRKKTKDTTIMGTSGYAAPEQFGFFRSDERTDIYSIGVLYNYLITGSTELGTYIGNAAVVKIIEECTQFSPEKRYKSCGEVMEDLRYLVDKPVNTNSKISVIIVRLIFIAAVFLEMVLIFACALSMAEGENVYKNMLLILDGAVLFILPFGVIGNWLDWQSHTGLNKMTPIKRRLVSTVIYIVILIIYIQFSNSAK